MARSSKAAKQRGIQAMKELFAAGGENAIREYAQKEARLIAAEQARLKMQNTRTESEMAESFFNEFMRDVNS